VILHFVDSIDSYANTEKSAIQFGTTDILKLLTAQKSGQD